MHHNPREIKGTMPANFGFTVIRLNKSVENPSPPYPGNAGQQLTRPQLSLLLVDAREEARERRRLGASQGQKRESFVL